MSIYGMFILFYLEYFVMVFYSSVSFLVSFSFNCCAMYLSNIVPSISLYNLFNVSSYGISIFIVLLFNDIWLEDIINVKYYVIF